MVKCPYCGKMLRDFIILAERRFGEEVHKWIKCPYCRKIFLHIKYPVKTITGGTRYAYRKWKVVRLPPEIAEQVPARIRAFEYFFVAPPLVFDEESGVLLYPPSLKLERIREHGYECWKVGIWKLGCRKLEEKR